jgi:hypothetical protein
MLLALLLLFLIAAPIERLEERPGYWLFWLVVLVYVVLYYVIAAIARLLGTG